MTDTAPTESPIQQIVQQFETATLDPGGFNHEAHILVGWRYLQDYCLLDAINRLLTRSDA